MPQARRRSVGVELPAFGERAGARGTTIPRPPAANSLPENRMSEDARMAAIKAALDGYVDPYLGEALGTAQAVKAVEPLGTGVLARIAHGFPVAGPNGGYAAALEAG